MAPRGQTRRRLIEAGSDLFRRRGYHGTGINDVLAEAGAPAGSLYFHFPLGKQELAAACVASAGEGITSAVEAASHRGGGPALEEYLSALATTLETSDWQCGCPIATVTLDTASQSSLVRESCAASYLSWRRAISTQLEQRGVEPEQAVAQATLILAATQGALILARAWQDSEPLLTVGAQLTRLLGAAPDA